MSSSPLARRDTLGVEHQSVAIECVADPAHPAELVDGSLGPIGLVQLVRTIPEHDDDALILAVDGDGRRRVGDGQHGAVAAPEHLVGDPHRPLLTGHPDQWAVGAVSRSTHPACW